MGNFQILSVIGAGGMGEVYRARDTRLDRVVAIKVLPAHLSQRAELRERFELEARTISSLNHPHICSLYDIGEHEETRFLVMEYLEGETLAARLTKGALPMDEVLRYAIQVADALDKAHRQGVTHRDLKPGNIMLTKSGAKLLDFGLAKQGAPVSQTPVAGISSLPTGVSPHSLTLEGTILGTLQYMAPEQLEGKDADARTDIFAFGATLYEMATGRKAFQGKSQVSLIAAIMDYDPPPISSVEPLTPPLFDRLVRTCLAKDPDRRWQNAADVLIQIQAIAETGAALETQTAKRGIPRREKIAWGALLVLVLAGVALAVFGV